MTETLVADVLVIGEGCTGLTAALAASEEGCDVVLFGDGHPPATAISTGFLAYAGHEGFTRDQLLQALAEAIAAYRIPVDRVERRARAAGTRQEQARPVVGLRGRVSGARQCRGHDGAHDVVFIDPRCSALRAIA